MHARTNKLTQRLRLSSAFTLLELQIAIILLAFAMTTLASLMTTQHRVLKRAQGDFEPGASIYITRYNEPWAKSLNTAARITGEPIDLSPPPIVHAHKELVIVSQINDLNEQSITVIVDVAEAP